MGLCVKRDARAGMLVSAYASGGMHEQPAIHKVRTPVYLGVWGPGGLQQNK